MIRIGKFGALLLGSALTSGAVSFSLDPWISVIEPGKGKISQIVTLKYVGDEVPVGKKGTKNTAPIPVELTIQPRSVTPDGKVVHDTAATVEAFSLFPSQLILYPGDIQKVQMHWVGESLPAAEQVYSLIATQVPVNLDGDEVTQGIKGQVTVLTRYEGVIILRPEGTKPDVIVDSVALADSLDSLPQLVVKLTNRGTGMQLLRGVEFTIIPIGEKGKSLLEMRKTYRPELASSMTKHSLLAGQSRIMKMDWPPNIPVGKVQIIPVFQ